MMYIRKSKYRRAAYIIGDVWGDGIFEEEKFDASLLEDEAGGRSREELVAMTHELRPTGDGRVVLPKEIYDALEEPEYVKLIGVGRAFYIVPTVPPVRKARG